MAPSTVESHSGFIVLVDISGDTRVIMGYKRFGTLKVDLEQRNACDGCLYQACCERGDLRIKIIAHAGEFVIKAVAGFASRIERGT